jgi:hypothetical protein
MLAGVALSAGAAWFEWTRALRGREVAWVYAFEWPLFAVMGIYVWWKLLRGDRPGRNNRVASGASRGRPTAASASDDAGLAAWQDYLSRLHATDPPGGPPHELTAAAINAGSEAARPRRRRGKADSGT